MNATNKTGDTALHYAALCGNDVCVTELLRVGAMVNACNALGMTPLHGACSTSWVSCAARLLEHGADPNAALCGIAPLYFAVTNESSYETVRVLLKHGAHVEGMKAIETKHMEKLYGPSLILEEISANISSFAEMYATTTFSSDFNHPVKSKREDIQLTLQVLNLVTPLHLAILGNLRKCVEILLACGANVNARGPFGITPIMLAAYCYPDCKDILITHGCEIDAKNDAGVTAVFVAAEEDSVTSVLDLIDAGADINIVRNDGHTPITVAAMKGYIYTCQALRKGLNKVSKKIFSILLLEYLPQITGPDRVGSC